MAGCAIVLGCGGGGGGGGGGQHSVVTKTADFTVDLPRQQVWEGVIPYAAQFPTSQPPYGNLVSLKNPNQYALMLFNPSDVGATVTLAAGSGTTADDMNTLYRVSNPPLPVKLVAVPQIANGGVLDATAIVVRYTYQE